MLLAVDVGNTQTHVGAFRYFSNDRSPSATDDSKGRSPSATSCELVEHWRFQTRGGATGDELADRLSGLLELRGLGFGDIDGLAVSSVVPPLGNEYSRLCSRFLQTECLLVGPGVKTGMPIKIENPHEVGADRLVNAVAAYERFGQACVVVDFGTGINFDAVSDEGEYLGGAIAPGIEISLTALAQRAARVPWIDLQPPEAAIGRSTRGAIQSGFVFGFAGLIDGIARRLEAEMGEGVEFIATGGLATAIVPFCETIEEIDDLLTLTGLRLIHERNA